MPTGDPLVFTAPNLQYLMDSPTRVRDDRRGARSRGRSPAHAVTVFGSPSTTPAPTPTPTRLPTASSKIVEQERAVFGEFPPFEPGTYTFLVDYLPWANGDGMEHRNSTVITRRARSPRAVEALETIAHEFFHCWNVERIRPASLEPFDSIAPNMSGELWLAEGFTSYYDPLIARERRRDPAARVRAVRGPLRRGGDDEPCASSAPPRT